MDDKTFLTDLQTLPTWTALRNHYTEVKALKMTDLFAADPQRGEVMSIDLDDIYLDYSKNRVTPETISLLMQLAKERGLSDAIAAMFRGDKINTTEHRAVLHTALRCPIESVSRREVSVDGHNVLPDVHKVLDKMEAFVDSVHSGQWRGYTGKTIETIINIGIGGSDLGPQMVITALKPYWKKGLKPEFIANIDGSDINSTLQRLDPERALFIVASKSFTSKETLANANFARQWLIDQLGDEQCIAKHFVAVSTQADLVQAFGIDPDHMFEFWDWVGGRYSLWSAIGLPIALMVGMDHFRELLAGAHEMDEHFYQAPFEQNMPVMMAMLGVWYRNFFHAPSHAILPYDHSLRKLPAYLQQADMESNGKYVQHNGVSVEVDTGPIIWGAAGTNGQHAFYQLIHQGTQLIPADFLLMVNSHHTVATPKDGNHHQVLLANGLAQTEALMRGRKRENVEADPTIGAELIEHCIFEGNRPTNTLVIDQLTPLTLGKIIALYEHKIFVQGVIWGINSFDQWGVELGKRLASAIEPELRGEAATREHDGSTNRLIARCRDRFKASS